ncbi:hypothetical protein JOQ06_021648, partial [Pogonophryne albipinna]
MDQRAEASKENEDRHAMASKEIREEQLVHSCKAQEAEEQLLMVMARQADVSARQVDVSARQADVSARQVDVSVRQYVFYTSTS